MMGSHVTRNWVAIARAAAELLEGLDDVDSGRLALGDLDEDRKEMRMLLETAAT